MARPLKRVTVPTRLVLAAFMEAPADEHYGLDLAAKAGIQSGSLYPILSRLEEYEWLVSYWEQSDPSQTGRPRRRYYRLTGPGIDLAREALASAPAGFFRWLPGGATP